MWWNDHMCRVIVEERIRQFHSEAERDRRAMQGTTPRGSGQATIVHLLRKIGGGLLRWRFLPLRSSVWHR